MRIFHWMAAIFLIGSALLAMLFGTPVVSLILDAMDSSNIDVPTRSLTTYDNITAFFGTTWGLLIVIVVVGLVAGAVIALTKRERESYVY